MNRIFILLTVFIFSFTSVSGCLNDSEDSIRPVPIGSWFSSDGYIYHFYSGGTGKMSFVDEFYWERNVESMFDGSEIFWEKNNNSITISNSNSSLLEGDIIDYEDEEYFSVSSSSGCNHFIYFDFIEIQNEADLSSAWRSFDGMRNENYKRTQSADDCYSTQGGKVSIINGLVLDDDTIVFHFELAPGSSWVIDVGITWSITCSRENTTHTDVGNFENNVTNLADEKTNLIEPGAPYVIEIKLTYCTPVLNAEDSMFIRLGGSSTSESLYYSSLEPGSTII